MDLVASNITGLFGAENEVGIVLLAFRNKIVKSQFFVIFIVEKQWCMCMPSVITIVLVRIRVVFIG